MSHGRTHRKFLQQSALSAVGLWAVTRYARAEIRSPNEKLGIAVIGVAGQGGYSVANVAGETIVALCDVDENRAAEARQKFRLVYITISGSARRRTGLTTPPTCRGNGAAGGTSEAVGMRTWPATLWIWLSCRSSGGLA